MSHQPDPQDLFRWKPIRVARVSEISETTAAAPIPPENRLNFHIGNPLQDSRLSSAYMRAAVGLDVQREDLRDTHPEQVLEHLGWSPSDKAQLEFLIRVIQKSGPYLPRGGYSLNAPNPLIELFFAWLQNQSEPLSYDSGEKSGRREVILASGGIHETLRVILVAISWYLQIKPARILCYRQDLLPELKAIPNLLFDNLSDDEQTAWEQIEGHLSQQPQAPTFLLIGAQLGEATRRNLRLLGVERPLYFIEANNVHNHLSLAREAKLVQRVIRLLNPAIFGPPLQTLSTVFVAGNADFLKVIENVHFNLKGTPCASEVEFLTYLLEQKLAELQASPLPHLPRVKPPFGPPVFGLASETALPRLVDRTEQSLEHMLDDRARSLSSYLDRIEQKIVALSQESRSVRDEWIYDEFSIVDAKQLLEQLIEIFHHPQWCQALYRSFLSVFVRHQPQYRPESCQIVSGSTRTALGILGFHCGIREVVIPDLSWSYEQCFPVVHALSLTASLELDADAIIEKVQQLRRSDSSWPERGAVVINNPHNATGRIFDQQVVTKLIKYCLQHGILLIDDLSYQNVAPLDELPEIKTARQITSELVRLGELQTSQADRLITVHSMSKTDCLAGARLAVIEIRDQELAKRFAALNSHIHSNLAAIFISYLFYRSTPETTRTYWHLRNAIFNERMQALQEALQKLPANRNPFDLTILPPTGSMYPLLTIGKLPRGLSLDWLASSLARRGIGLLPLATFSRTEKGYETGRKTFRLTLGGVDGAVTLLSKTRRLLIDLNRLIAEEDAHYNRKQLPIRSQGDSRVKAADELGRPWEFISHQVQNYCRHFCADRRLMAQSPLDNQSLRQDFLNRYLPERLEGFRTRLLDRGMIADGLLIQAQKDNGQWLTERLEREFMKDSLQRRQELFRMRSYDRTVHPTQMYSLPVELAFNEIVDALVSRWRVAPSLLEKVALELWQEYLGRNVAISSQQEADEILLDLATLVAGEEYAHLFTGATLTPFLSFWSDWDGSNRPSGQGHRLVAVAVMENVRRMSHLLKILHQVDPTIEVNPDLLSGLALLPRRNRRFTRLLDDITMLTHQLELRYRGILPYSVTATPLQRLATRWHLRRDPARVLFQHNDRYERKMVALRQQRRTMLEYYFSLNKQLRKQLYALIPAILMNRDARPLLSEVVGYRDILQRTVITPRIHQGLIIARDPFSINTTVYNLYEINAIAGKYGNPGMVLALQVSLSSKPEALISLDRKMRHQSEQTHREFPSVELPPIWLVPLFEETDVVTDIPQYLDRLWDYSTQSRHMAQSTPERFAEIMVEIFIAGSDLSQQVSQATAAFHYLRSKHDLQLWLAEHGLAEAIRIKLGSGEPMQRQGGYYSSVAGCPTFLDTEDSRRRFSTHLPAAARRSTAYAVTPLQGIFLARDLKTFQSNLSEQLRSLPVQDFISLLDHVREAQQVHRSNLIRTAEAITESRLGAQHYSTEELKRLTFGTSDVHYEDFLKELTDNFRHILYGHEEDIVGMHTISYFIGRSIPQLRDRPTSRHKSTTGVERGEQILVSIAEIIPLAKHGSLLRAIAHNQAQTVVLGYNQLTTGLFRALERFTQKSFVGAERERMVSQHLMPHLPVYEILHTLRIYQDYEYQFINHIETAFPAGNSAFVALREDKDAMQRKLPLLQQELLRRQGLNVHDFFYQGVFNAELLPTLRPDLAVLLQADLFNTDPEILLESISGRISAGWRDEVANLLRLPQQVQYWRSIIWDVLGESLFQRVQSFTELATALYAFSSTRSLGLAPGILRTTKPSTTLAGFFRATRADDEMRSFLLSAIDYLSSFDGENIEVPVSIIRAINDVERIARIEESALPPATQDVIRCSLIQIARLAGENG
jgi:aspartate/methionine/tyrosine aminotransferase